MKMGKKEGMQMLHIHPNKKIDVINVPTEENQAIIKKEKTPLFDPDDVFMMKMVSRTPILGGWINRRRKRVQTLMYVDGKPRCEKLTQKVVKEKNGDQKTTFEILSPVTEKETKDIVKRVMALGLKEFKPISLIMFIIICILLVAVIIEGLIILGRIGMFKEMFSSTEAMITGMGLLL